MKKLNMYPHNLPGTLITFCGLDGCGKTTILHQLASTLCKQGLEVVITKQPTDFVRQSAIFRTYMDDPDHSAYDYRSLSLLAASDRVQHANHWILPALQQGKVVLCDRYLYSCLANLRARGFTKDRWLYEIARSIPQPDAAFFLDVPVEEAIRRVRSREEERDRYIDVPLQHRLRREYQDLSRCRNSFLLSTLEPQEEVFAAVCNTVQNIIERKNHHER